MVETLICELRPVFFSVSCMTILIKTPLFFSPVRPDVCVSACARVRAPEEHGDLRRKKKAEFVAIMCGCVRLIHFPCAVKQVMLSYNLK